eukprot:5207710-Pyramimonas_sp.AAC.1
MRETLKSASADPVRELMGLDLVTTLKCDGTEEQFTERQTVYSLKCNITSEVRLRNLRNTLVEVHYSPVNHASQCAAAQGEEGVRRG